MGIMNRIASITASKKAERIARESRRRKVISKRREGRRTVKEYFKESARPYLTSRGRRKLKIDKAPQKYKRVKKGKKYIKVKIKKEDAKKTPRRSFQQRTGFVLNQRRLKWQDKLELKDI